MRVLVVDDSKLAGRHLIKMFSAFPEVELLGQVGDGFKAMGYIRTLRPDVVILDVDLPAQNGFEILRHVKQENLAWLVMVLTAMPFPEYRESCTEALADFYFDKSVGFGRVRQTFRQLIHGSWQSANSHEAVSPKNEKRIGAFDWQEGWR